jgi:GT2 family glycosyltransferase
MDREIQQNIDVSIIIVNYNSFKLLRRCLDSIFYHTKDLIYEIIIIDNNSVEEDVNNLANEYVGLRIYKNDRNLGFAKANNIGATYARGKYLLLLNNDTELLENSVKFVFEHCESKNSKILVGCKLLNQDGTIQSSTYKFPSPGNLFTSNFFIYPLLNKSPRYDKSYVVKSNQVNPLETEVIIGAFIFLRTCDYIELHGFDERFFFYNEDADLCYRFIETGGKVIYLPGTAVKHVGGGTAKFYKWFHFKNRSISQIKFFQKHFKGVKFFTSVFLHFSGIIIRVPIFLIIGSITFNKNMIARGLYYILLIFIYPKNNFKSNN